MCCIAGPRLEKGTSRRQSTKDVAAAPAGNSEDFGPYPAFEVVRVKQIFDSFDTDGSGSVLLKEFINCAAWRMAYSPVCLCACACV